MRFSVSILLWLTFAISLVAAVAGNFGVNIFVVGLIGVYLFAPLWLTLFSSFAQAIRPKTRLHLAYGIMLVLVVVTVLISSLFMLQAYSEDESLPALFAVVVILMIILGLWSAQVDIMRDVHERQSQGHRQRTRRQSSSCAALTESQSAKTW